MRLTLFFLLLFSLTGGSSASAFHTGEGGQVFHGVPTTQSDRFNAAFLFVQNVSIYPDAGTRCIIFADIEDEENSNDLSSRKTRTQSRAVSAFTCSALLSSRPSYRFFIAKGPGVLSRLYLRQRSLRI
jgi:hypothetical protein